MKIIRTLGYTRVYQLSYLGHRESSPKEKKKKGFKMCGYLACHGSNRDLIRKMTKEN